MSMNRRDHDSGMRIDRIEIRNFHGFKVFELDLVPTFNLVIGDNASGKTGLLDALAVGIGGFFLGFADISGRNIRPDEVHRETRIEAGQPVQNPYYPVEVVCRGVINGEHISWTRTLERKGGKTKSTPRLRRLSESLYGRIGRGEAGGASRSRLLRCWPVMGSKKGEVRRVPVAGQPYRRLYRLPGSGFQP